MTISYWYDCDYDSHWDTLEGNNCLKKKKSSCVSAVKVKIWKKRVNDAKLVGFNFGNFWTRSVAEIRAERWRFPVRLLLKSFLNIPKHRQIFETNNLRYFQIMKGSLLKGKQISLLWIGLQKHKKYDLKKSIPPIRQGSWILSSLLFCLHRNEGGRGIIGKNWYIFGRNFTLQMYFLTI